MSKILAYNYKGNSISIGQASLSDTIRMALHQNDSSLFSMLDYNNDSIFLEPTLFCHFLSDIDKTETIPLVQCLVGYIPIADRPESISVKADRFGLVNLPNLGYVRANPYETFTFNIAELEKTMVQLTLT